MTVAARAGAGHPRVALSSSSVYPLGLEATFQLAAELGYDGIELMVLSDPATWDLDGVRALSREYDVPVLSLHAPCLLVTQRVWGTLDPWTKLDRSIDLAFELETDVVVVHPPFRWQKDYAADFCDGVAVREHERRVHLAVENMYPWRAGNRSVEAYLPHWDPVPYPYDNVTLDFSHAATAGSDVLEMQAALGPRLRHVHLTDGSGSVWDEHLLPGDGGQPCGEFLQRLADKGYDGVVAVEVSTRKRLPEQRVVDLAEALVFARLHLGADPVPVRDREVRS